MDFRILGPLEVVGDTRPVALPRGRGRALLALLVLRAGEVAATDRLIDELWGQEPPPTANKSLHNLISNLRRRLDAGRGARLARPSVLATSGAGYVLQIDPEQVDASRFRQLVEEASGAAPEERASRLREALALWRGPALADFTYEPFAQADIAMLEELRLTTVEERVEADLALGRHATLVGELEGRVADHPFRERPRAQLMLALYRCGRQADALEVYQAGRQALVEELGIEPGPTLRDLERAILGHDPALALPAGRAGTATADAATDSWLGEARKTVTVLYVELAESASGPQDPEAVRRLVAEGVDVATTILERHGGTVEGFIGSVLVAVFGVPTAHEDDALRAATAAVELCDAIEALHGGTATDRGVRLVARVGINTGEVVVSDAAGGPAAASGDAVQLAARLQQVAGAGDVLIGEVTRQLLGEAARVESVATLVLDRRGRPTTVWRLGGLASEVPGRTPDPSEPLVGRKGELTQLHAAFQRTLRQGCGALCTVSGEAGVGKSRLAREFVAALADEVEVLWCRCSASGEASTFWPLRELVLQATGDRGLDGIAALLSGHDDAEVVAGQVAAAIGLRDEAAVGPDLFPAVGQLMETLARRQPAVVVVDDIHWAQPTFLDLVDYLADSVRAPLLLVCLGRPELLDQRRASEAEPAASFVLEPLSRHEGEQLVASRLAGRLVPDDAVAQLVEMAEGNPLFIEQLVAALRDTGRLHFPPSVHALLAARLDRLGPAERDLLRCASVVGSEFSLEALTALVPDRGHAFLAQHLDALRRKELIGPPRRPPLGGRTFAFRHALIRHAAYRSTTREARARLHQRLAEWIEERAAPELEEVVAYHLEQAHEQRRQLGYDDEATHALARRAGERLAAAGLRAYGRFDMTAAEGLLSRARALLPADHPQRYEVLRRLSQAYPTLGRLADAEAVLEDLLQDPHVQEDVQRKQRLRLEQLRIRLIAGPDPVRQEAIRTEVARAFEVLEPLEDHAGLSAACYLLATMHLRAGEIRELEDIGRRGLEHARRSGDLRELLGALWWPSWALVAGPTPVADAIRAVEGLLQAAGHRPHIGVMTDLARLRAMRGEFDTARDLVQRSRREAVERVRVRRALTVVAHRTAEVEILAGNLEAAEAVLRPALEVALDVGERDQTAQIAAELSRVLTGRGAREEAARLAAVSREQAPAESVAAQALWRAATARASALGEDSGEFEQLAREAIAHVPADLLDLRAGLHLDLSEVMLAIGQRAPALAAAREAADLYERKGNLVGAARARKLATA